MAPKALSGDVALLLAILLVSLLCYYLYDNSNSRCYCCGHCHIVTILLIVILSDSIGFIAVISRTLVSVLTRVSANTTTVAPIFRDVFLVNDPYRLDEMGQCITVSLQLLWAVLVE